MTDSQLLAIALASAPTLITVLIGILINNARLGDIRHYMDARFNEVNSHFNDVDRRFNEIDGRFDRVDGRFEELKELWRSELHRVEEVLDARLKHLEERS